MTQTTGSQQMWEWFHSLAEDTSISSRAVAFAAGIVPLVVERRHGTRSVYVSRREVEIVTGMKHGTWPLDEVQALGVSVDVPKPFGTVVKPKETVGEASVWEVPHFGPTACATSSSSRRNTAVVDVVDVSLCGPELRYLDRLRLMDPTNLLWTTLGRYKHDWWRWVLLMGVTDHPVTPWLLRQVLGVSSDQATRMMARARAKGYVVESTFMGSWIVDGLHATGFDDFTKAARFRQERQTFLAAKVPPAQEPEPVTMSEAQAFFAAKVPSAQEPAPVTMNERWSFLAARMVAIQ